MILVRRDRYEEASSRITPNGC